MTLFILIPAEGFAQRTSSQDIATAEDLYEESRIAYREGRFSDAAELLGRAYRTYPSAVFLYNQGRAYESAGQLGLAVRVYERYLGEAGEIEDRAGIEQRVSNLRAMIAERSRAEDAARAANHDDDDVGNDPPVDTPPGEEASRAYWPFAVLGVAAGTAAVGLGFGAASRAAHDEAVTASSHEAAFAAQERHVSQTHIANGLFVAAGILGAAGTLFAILFSRDPGSDEDEDEVEVSVGPTSVSARIHF